MIYRRISRSGESPYLGVIGASTFYVFIQVVNHLKTRIPNTTNILLTTTNKVTIIHIQNSIHTSRQTADIHPDDKLTTSSIIKFYLMIQLVTIIISKNNITTRRLCLTRKISIGNINQNREVCKISIHLIMINIYPFTIQPVIVPPPCRTNLCSKTKRHIRPITTTQRISSIHTPPIHGIITIHVYRNLTICPIRNTNITTDNPPATRSICPKRDIHQITLIINQMNRQQRIQNHTHCTINWVLIRKHRLIRKHT